MPITSLDEICRLLYMEEQQYQCSGSSRSDVYDGFGCGYSSCSSVHNDRACGVKNDDIRFGHSDDRQWI
ncbi:Hypothetical predicted protein [Octopus vulgaris]|uniref:Uncharacterized protein n=1 Tax=Octopus vulgaris TaxID=6645 RepID=A0AA36B699_OCTVU|nr:Hypothetical predicted protein [Octopus vulgaris]